MTPVVRRHPRSVYRRRRLAVGAIFLALVVALSAASWWVWQPSGPVVAAGPAPVADRAPSTTPPQDPATTTTQAEVTPTTAPPSTTAPPPPAPTTGGPAVGPLALAGKALPVVHRVETTDPVVFLTLDDGVVRDPALIELVRQRNLPITMFLTEDYAAGGDYFEQLVGLGARVESHTITHPTLRGRDAGFQEREICGPSAGFAGRFGEPVRYFRPPYGRWDDTTLAVGAGCGMKAMVHWNATMDGGEFNRSGGGPLRAGDIVLLHFKDDTVANLELLLEFMSALGLRPAQLSDYLDAAPVA